MSERRRLSELSSEEFGEVYRAWRSTHPQTRKRLVSSRERRTRELNR